MIIAFWHFHNNGNNLIVKDSVNTTVVLFSIFISIKIALIYSAIVIYYIQYMVMRETSAVLIDNILYIKISTFIYVRLYVVNVLWLYVWYIISRTYVSFATSFNPRFQAALFLSTKSVNILYWGSFNRVNMEKHYWIEYRNTIYQDYIELEVVK